MLKSLFLKYFQKNQNVGDQFSLAVAKHYFSSNVVPCDESLLAVPNLILVGSVLEFADSQSHICGAGFISSNSKLHMAPKSIHCVRGPLTRYLLERQGIFCPGRYADPGVLAPQMYPQNDPVCCKIGIIPHYVDAKSPWVESCRQKGIKIIDVFSPLDKFFSEINQCEVIFSSSLHGIIFAHSYGKPALWTELSDKLHGDGFKFFDYYMSLGVTPEKVMRVSVTNDTDPYKIFQLATIEDQTELLAPLNESISKAMQQLRRDQTLMRVKEKLMLSRFHLGNKIPVRIRGCLNKLRRS